MSSNTHETTATSSTPTATEEAAPRALRRTVVALGLPVAVALAGLGTATAAHAFGNPQSITRTWNDGSLDWTVPAATHQITLTVVGGSGQDSATSGGGAPGASGGRGGVVHEVVAVTPGQVISLLPGSAGSTHSSYGHRYGGAGGGSGAFVSGGGGNGGSASAVVRSGQTLAVAGGGGGAGGGGSVYNYTGGNGGDAQAPGGSGSGAAAGSGGSGNVAGTSTNQVGEDGGGAPDSSFAGGGGGGGGGWNGNTLGGGVGGNAGDYGGGGGGGGAGGLSYGLDPNATYSVSPAAGDGYIVLDWTPSVSTTSTLTAPASVPQGRPITFTDQVTPAESGGPAMTGTVTFEAIDTLTYQRTILGTVGLNAGVAQLTLPALPSSTLGVHAIYNGDASYETSTSDFVYPTLTAPIKTLTVSPSPLAFGNVTVHKLVTRQVTVTNTGSIAWAWTGAATDNGDVNMPATTCGTVAPGASCTVSVSFQPHTTGPITGNITLSSNFGPIVIAATGTGVAPRPVVSALSPTSGPAAGGTTVRVTGKNFVGVTKILVGGKAMTGLTCSTTTSCTGVTPAHAAGVTDVQVVAAGGTSAVVAADHYTYH